MLWRNGCDGKALVMVVVMVVVVVDMHAWWRREKL
jgi:hypothetical protein